MLKLKRLTTNEDIENYLTKFEQRVGVGNLPRAYYHQNKVYGIFKNRRLVGGYTIVTNHLRGLMFIPSDVLSTRLAQLSLSEDDLLEVNGLWIASGENSLILRGFFWSTLVYKILTSKRRACLTWFNNRIQHLHRVYGFGGFEQIYVGAPNAIGASKSTHGELCAGFMMPRRLPAGLVRLATYYAFRR